MDADKFSKQVKKIILDKSYTAHVGHIGSALSVADMVAMLYANVLRIQAPDDHDRDRFVLSKGHTALALYAALYVRGFISEDDLLSFGRDGTLLGVHPEHRLAGIDFSTGSLGQGLSYGAGSALAARMQRSARRVFVLMSDAECNEGSAWEAAMFAAHHRLSNLILLIDLNGQQALGYTKDVMNLSPMSNYWRTFGWDVHDVDGHDISAMENVIAHLDTISGPPHVLVAHTTSGKGVSFMENQIKWHYWPLSDEEYKQAVQEVMGTL